MEYRAKDVPFVSPEDPLPAGPEPQGRWAMPYQRMETELWMCHLWHPLTQQEADGGLVDTLAARTEEELWRLQDEEDARAERYRICTYGGRTTC